MDGYLPFVLCLMGIKCTCAVNCFCSWFLVFTNTDNILPDVLLPSAFLTHIRAECRVGVPLAADATLQPGVGNSIKWQVRAPLNQIIKDRMGRKGPGELLTSSSPSLRGGGINKDPTGSISFGGVCVWCAPDLWAVSVWVFVCKFLFPL